MNLKTEEKGIKEERKNDIYLLFDMVYSRGFINPNIKLILIIEFTKWTEL